MGDGKSRVEILMQTTYYMLHMGFQARQKGYRYIREAVWIAYLEPEKLTSVTKLLYPEIARLFHTTDKKIERAMRNAIETTWSTGNKEAIGEIFGSDYIEEDKRPTNTEFIVTLLKYIGRAED